MALVTVPHLHEVKDPVDKQAVVNPGIDSDNSWGYVLQEFTKTTNETWVRCDTNRSPCRPSVSHYVYHVSRCWWFDSERFIKIISHVNS